MQKEEKETGKGEIIIYKSAKGPEIEVKLEKNTIWLDAHLIAKIFEVNRPAVVKHINNIYKTGELESKSTCSIMEQVAKDGKIRKMNLYNLDMIISVGYRVNSLQATQFRIWATKTLKHYLIKGYTINEKRLVQAQNNLTDLKNTIDYLQEKSKHSLLTGKETEIFSLLSAYSKSLSILEKYDSKRLPVIKGNKAGFTITYKIAGEIISQVKKDLVSKKEAGHFFGEESGHKLESVINNIYQTFEGKQLYSGIEEKASHLLYLTIKDHPFIDGNKRIASFLFIYFLSRNNFLHKENGEKKINDNALVALSLLIAVSDPKEKETMIKIITHLVKD